MRRGAAALCAGVLALAGCSGESGQAGATGPAGPAGPAGQDGADITRTAKAESCATCHPKAGVEHQAVYNSFADGLNPATSKLVATIESVTSTPGAVEGTFDVTMAMTLKNNGVPANPATMTQKRYMAVQFDPATSKFITATAFRFGNATGFDAATGAFTVAATGVRFDPTATSSFVYAYLGDTLLLPVKGHYNLLDNVASVAKTFGTWSYVSKANVSACVKCHQENYAKHGFRQAEVGLDASNAPATARLKEFIACKGCHHDSLGGTDQIFQILVDDPPAAAALLKAAAGGDPDYTADQLAKYAYTANIMNDTHMSHAMEFAYPQSMANCTMCHAGKLDQILTDANFTLQTCRSCHAVVGAAQPDPKRAPPLKTLLTAGPLAQLHTMDLYTYTGSCNTCHGLGGPARRFNQMHPGYSETIYSDAAGTKYSSTIKTNLAAASFDPATKKLTFNFTVTGASASAVIKPTVVMSLYGYDTKDFIVGGHASTGGLRNLEWTEGAANNSPRLTVVPATATAGNASWTATADLTLWAGLLDSGAVKRVEIGILPALGVNQAAAPQNDKTKAGYNPYLAIAGASKTFDLAANAVMADAATAGWTKIVDPAKCDKCHDALGTTFHSPAYGAAGVVGCRLCHVVGSGGSHLEMQSRSIDSYVHAIHTMQKFDIRNVDFSDPVQAMQYGHHVESTYPNFTTLNCESCHNPNTYGVPDQSRSLPGVLSASAAVAGRNIGTVPSYVVGPASRACGGCHRAEMINEDAAGRLASFNAHTDSFGTQLENGTGVFDEVVAKIMAMFK